MLSRGCYQVLSTTWTSRWPRDCVVIVVHEHLPGSTPLTPNSSVRGLQAHTKYEIDETLRGKDRKNAIEQAAKQIRRTPESRRRRVLKCIRSNPTGISLPISICRIRRKNPRNLTSSNKHENELHNCAELAIKSISSRPAH